LLDQAGLSHPSPKRRRRTLRPLQLHHTCKMP
jgi:hypothetical protein